MAQIVHKINSSAQMMFDILHPVGEVYTQYPECEEPNNLYNNDDVQSVWTELNFEGAFFRADGGNASVFGSGLQSEGIKSHTHAYKDTLSTKHTSTPYGTSLDFEGVSGVEMLKNKYGYGGSYYAYNPMSDRQPANSYPIYAFYRNRTTNIDTTTITETRPANYTIKIWKRTE